jgi:hypothetical protein
VRAVAERTGFPTQPCQSGKSLKFGLFSTLNPFFFKRDNLLLSLTKLAHTSYVPFTLDPSQMFSLTKCDLVFWGSALNNSIFGDVVHTVSHHLQKQNKYDHRTFHNFVFLTKPPLFLIMYYLRDNLIHISPNLNVCESFF